MASLSSKSLLASSSNESSETPSGSITSEVNEEHFPFMKLPTELRLRVFHHALQGTRIRFTGDSYYKLRVHSILFVSRQVRAEATDALHKIGIVQIVVDHGAIQIGDRNVELGAAAGGPVTAMLRNAKHVILKVNGSACISLGKTCSDTYFPYDCSSEAESSEQVEDIFKFAYDKAYAVRRKLTELVSHLLTTQLRSFRVLSEGGDEEDAQWTLAPLRRLRNILDVQIRHRSDHQWYPLERIATDMGRIEQVNMRRRREEYAALREFVLRLDGEKHGFEEDTALEEAEYHLTCARIASKAGNTEEFEKQKCMILELWEDEIERRQEGKARLARDFKIYRRKKSTSDSVHG